MVNYVFFEQLILGLHAIINYNYILKIYCITVQHTNTIKCKLVTKLIIFWDKVEGHSSVLVCHCHGLEFKAFGN